MVANTLTLVSALTVAMLAGQASAEQSRRDTERYSRVAAARLPDDVSSYLLSATDNGAFDVRNWDLDHIGILEVLDSFQVETSDELPPARSFAGYLLQEARSVPVTGLLFGEDARIAFLEPTQDFEEASDGARLFAEQFAFDSGGLSTRPATSKPGQRNPQAWLVIVGVGTAAGGIILCVGNITACVNDTEQQYADCQAAVGVVCECMETAIDDYPQCSDRCLTGYDCCFGRYEDDLANCGWCGRNGPDNDYDVCSSENPPTARAGGGG